MKKLSIFLSFLFAFTFLFLTGCNPSNNSDWVDIQKITYAVESSQSFTSTCLWDISIDEIEESEYESVPDHQKSVTSSNPRNYYSEEIDINKKDFLSKVKKQEGRTFYYAYENGYNNKYTYYKVTYKAYELRYVKVRFLENNNLEIMYFETMNNSEYTTLRVLPLSYQITYFI